MNSLAVAFGMVFFGDGVPMVSGKSGSSEEYCILWEDYLAGGAGHWRALRKWSAEAVPSKRMCASGCQRGARPAAREGD